jgi:electron transfer flavoprotein alpha subunit
MPKEVWVWFEQREGTVSETCFELASAGKQLAQKLNAGLTAILVGYHLDNSLHSLLGLTDRIITVDHERLCAYQPRTYTQVVTELIERDPPLLLIFPGTYQSNDLAPRVSFHAQAPLVSDCVEMKVKGDSFLFTRPVFSENIYETLTLAMSLSPLVSLRPKIFNAAKPPKTVLTKVSPFEPVLPMSDEGLRINRYIKVDPRKIDIAFSEIVVAGGRGLGDNQSFGLIRELADLLGGSVAGSRMAVDLGWIPFERQIGLTGKTISPKLLIALGISGAFEFLSGMRNSLAVMAVNNNPKAPIFQVADVSVVEDVKKILPELINFLKNDA